MAASFHINKLMGAADQASQFLRSAHNLGKVEMSVILGASQQRLKLLAPFYYLSAALNDELSSSERELLVSEILGLAHDGLWGLGRPDLANSIWACLALYHAGAKSRAMSVMADIETVFGRPDGFVFDAADPIWGNRIMQSGDGLGGIVPELQVLVLLAARELKHRLKLDLAPMIESWQQHNGSLTGGLSQDNHMMTAMAVEALADASAARAATYLRRQLKADGPGGQVGLTILSAFGLRHHQLPPKTLAWLLDHQSSDGSWQDSDSVWFSYQAAPGTQAKILDTGGILATAMMLMVLKSQGARLSRPDPVLVMPTLSVIAKETVGTRDKFGA